MGLSNASCRLRYRQTGLSTLSPSPPPRVDAGQASVKRTLSPRGPQAFRRHQTGQPSGDRGSISTVKAQVQQDPLPPLSFQLM